MILPLTFVPSCFNSSYAFTSITSAVIPCCGVATLPPRAVSTIFWFLWETRRARSSPRTQCGTITFSVCTSMPHARNCSVVHFTASAAFEEPEGRGPISSVRYDNVSYARVFDNADVTRRSASWANALEAAINNPATSHLRPVNLNVLRIDLRALQRAGVVDVARLPFREHVDAGHACFAMTVACLLRAAERQMRFRADGRSVHVEDAGVHVAHREERVVHVARVDRRRQSVAHAVADLDRILERLARDHRGHRSEDLLL